VAIYIANLNSNTSKRLPVTNWLYSNPPTGVDAAMRQSITAELEGMEHSKQCSDQAVNLTLAWLLPSNGGYMYALGDPAPPKPNPAYPPGKNPNARNSRVNKKIKNIPLLKAALEGILGPLIYRPEIAVLQTQLGRYDQCGADVTCKQNALSEVYAVSMTKLMNDFDLIIASVMSEAVIDRSGAMAALHKDIKTFARGILRPYGDRYITLVGDALVKAAFLCPWTTNAGATYRLSVAELERYMALYTVYESDIFALAILAVALS